MKNKGSRHCLVMNYRFHSLSGHSTSSASFSPRCCSRCRARQLPVSLLGTARNGQFLVQPLLREACFYLTITHILHIRDPLCLPDATSCPRRSRVHQGQGPACRPFVVISVGHDPGKWRALEGSSEMGNSSQYKLPPGTVATWRNACFQPHCVLHD